jgi:hypothetical protein
MTTGIEVAVTPLVVNIEVADPSKVGEAGATPVSAEINNDNKLDFLMSDGRHIVVDDYLFTRGSEANYDSVLVIPIVVYALLSSSDDA